MYVPCNRKLRKKQNSKYVSSNAIDDERTLPEIEKSIEIRAPAAT